MGGGVPWRKHTWEWLSRSSTSACIVPHAARSTDTKAAFTRSWYNVAAGSPSVASAAEAAPAPAACKHGSQLSMNLEGQKGVASIAVGPREGNATEALGELGLVPHGVVKQCWVVIRTFWGTTTEN